MPNQRTTGLTSQQFATLLTNLTHHLTWGKPGGRPPALTLAQGLKATLLYHRHNLTEELLAALFGTSQPTISRGINTIEHALEKILSPLNRPLRESLRVPGSLVVDGTLVPIWNWRSLGTTNFSGKHKKAGFNHQVICTLDGKLLAMTDPLPGARHDAYCFKEHGLNRFLDSSTLADKGYIGLGLVTPNKRPAGEKLGRNRKAVNRQINRLRSVVERVIANVMAWRVLHTGFRRPLGSYRRVFSVVRGLVFFAAGETFE
ncbi:transposase family protein [Rothia nasimurium]|uniref:transposase family protein n=1 Tax=Rothia nasimurium TaxID=85336 RepID=UPI0016290D27|nr:transposase family protein [Rothia nasimurium]